MKHNLIVKHKHRNLNLRSKLNIHCVHMINNEHQAASIDISKIASSQEDNSSQNDQSCGSASTVYTKYEHLVDIYNNYQDFGVVFDALLSNSDAKHGWKVHFELLEHLRTLNRFHYAELNIRISYFVEFVIRSLDSLRSNLSKDALIFLKEVIPSAEVKDLPAEFISKIIPVICDKAISDKTFIKSEAKTTLKLIEQYCAGDVAIFALSTKSSDKNVVICELAFQSLCDLVKQMDNNLQFKITLGGCKALFHTIIKALYGKRAAMKKNAESVWLHLKKVLEQACELQSFLEIKVGLTRAEVAALLAINADKKKKGYEAGRAQFQNFMKERKMMIETDVINKRETPEVAILEHKATFFVPNPASSNHTTTVIAGYNKENMQREEEMR